MTETPEQEPPEEPSSSKFTPINKMDPSEETANENEATHTLDNKPGDVGNGNTNGSNIKRKRKSSTSNSDGHGVDGSVDGDEDEDEDESTSAPSKEGAGDSSKGSKPRKTRKKGGDENVKEKPSAAKKPAGAGKKGKTAVGKGKATEKSKSEGQGEGNGEQNAPGITTPPPEKDTFKDEKDSTQSGDEKEESKAQKAKAAEWSQEEDVIIMNLHGKEKKQWKDVVEAINQRPGCLKERNIMACKNRWQKNLKHEALTWSDEELAALKSIYISIIKDPWAQLAESMNNKFAEKKFTKGGCEKKMKEFLKPSKGGD